MRYKNVRHIKFEDIPLKYQQNIYEFANGSEILSYYYGIDISFQEAEFNNYLDFYNYLITKGFEENTVVIIERIKYNSNWLFVN